MPYTPSDACMIAARSASKGMIPDDELREAFQRASDVKDKVTKAGFFDGYKDRVNQKILEDAEKTRIAAALQKQHAEIKVVLKDKLKTRIADNMKEGASLRQSVLAIIEGSQSGIKNGRVSIDTVKLSYLDKLITHPLGELEREVPGIRALRDDPNFDDDLTREWYQLSSGGKVGATGNKDAVKAAAILAKYSEFARGRANKAAPGSIGKLDTYAGAQIHNDGAMLRAGKDAWITAVLPRLDITRTFPDAQSAAEITHYLGEIFDTIVTGRDGLARPDTGRVGPASLAKSLGKSRALHFKDADAWIDYRKDFGYGNTLDGFVNSQSRMARSIAQMEVLGPNPAHMMQTLLDDISHEARTNPDLDVATKKDLVDNAKPALYDGALNVASGVAGRSLTAREASWASYSEAARAIQRMAKYGASSILAMPTDTVTAGVASMVRGGSFFHTITTHLSDMIKAINPQFRRQYLMMYGEGTKGLIDHTAARLADANDAVPGMISKMQNSFFKWTGLTGVTDMAKAIHNRLLSMEFAENAKSNWADLHPGYRFALEQSGIDEGKWRAIQAMGSHDIDGTSYLTPEMAEHLTDAQIAHLTADKVATANKALEARQGTRQAKTNTEQEWVQKRVFGLEAWMGRMEARIEDRIKTMKGERDAGLADLRDKIRDAHESLADLSDAYSQGDGSERTMARRELQYEQRIARTKKVARSILPDLAGKIDGIDEALNNRIAGHIDAIGKLEDRMTGAKTPETAAAASAKYQALEDAINEAIGKVDERKGSLNATAKERLEKLSGQLGELRSGLLETRQAFPVTKGEARGIGRAEGKTFRDIGTFGRRMADLDRQFQKVGKDKAARLHADYVERQGELKEFSDRMQRYADSRAAADAADVAAHPKRIADIHDETRFQLEMDMRRFMADQNRYAILEPDAASKRLTLLGASAASRPGTLAGEVTRHLMLAKGYPIAFTNQILKRAVVSRYYKGNRAAQAAHIGTLLAGLTAAGYVVTQVRNMINGVTPQVPTDPKQAGIVFLQSMLRGGALGIYGDYLVGTTNKYGSTLPEALAGPTAVEAGNTIALAQQALGLGSSKVWDELTSSPNSDAKGGGSLAGRALNYALTNTPGANIFYIRPAVDYLFLNALRDKANPGFLNRRDANLRQSGQTRWHSATMQ